MKKKTGAPNSSFAYRYYSHPPVKQAVTLPEKRSSTLMKPVLALIIAVVVVTLSSLFGFDAIKSWLLSGNPLAVASQKVSAAVKTPAATAPAPTPSPMDTEINGIIAQYPGVQTSVAAIDLTTGKEFDYGVQAPYEAASTGKLLTATLFLHVVEQGTYTLQTPVNGQTADYELQQMIEVSDNDAWDAFNSLLGHPALNDWAASAGMTSYDADANTMTVHDLATLLEKLYKKQLLNDTNTSLLLSYMANANRTEYIKEAVPSSISVYHKAGWLDDRANDAAIIDDGSHPYVLVIFTKVDGTYDEATGQDIFHQITTSTLKNFVPRSVTQP